MLWTDETISNGCYYHFMERQSNLTLCKGNPIVNVRMDYINPETMKEYFKMLKAVMTKHKYSTMQVKFTMLTKLVYLWIIDHQRLFALQRTEEGLLQNIRQQELNYCDSLSQCYQSYHTSTRTL